ncbi:MAG: SOS response-associated peptidase [Promethearchaeota archaeon]|nr:MAG: SOS response-associated peptidase [Candidatus Lokiarchaeota archaeon]
MCGRFARFSPAHVFRMLFQLDEFLELPPQYNIAPGQDVYAVRGIVIRDDEQQRAASDTSFEKEVVALKWGFIPFWSKDPSIGSRMINSRSETVAEKPAFKAAFKSRRCLIPTDGFYEWKKQKKGGKQPYFVHMKDEQPFALGGIWDLWKNPDGQNIESFSILTTEPNEVVKPIHKRMPLIIKQEEYDSWLNPDNDVKEVKDLLKPYQAKKMTAYPVSKDVNNPKNKGEENIKPLEEKYKQTTLS